MMLVLHNYYNYIAHYTTSKLFSFLSASSLISAFVCSSLSFRAFQRELNTSLVAITSLSFLFLILLFISCTPDTAYFTSSSRSITTSPAPPIPCFIIDRFYWRNYIFIPCMCYSDSWRYSSHLTFCKSPCEIILILM